MSRECLLVGLATQHSGWAEGTPCLNMPPGLWPVWQKPLKTFINNILDLE